MKMNDIPFELQNKLRLIIITALQTGEKTFTELKSITKATDGNLSVQLKCLEEADFIKSTKDFYQNKPRTTYFITNLGKNTFVEYVLMLEKYI